MNNPQPSDRHPESSYKPHLPPSTRAVLRLREVAAQLQQEDIVARRAPTAEVIESRRKKVTERVKQEQGGVGEAVRDIVSLDTGDVTPQPGPVTRPHISPDEAAAIISRNNQSKRTLGRNGQDVGWKQLGRNNLHETASVSDTAVSTIIALANRYRSQLISRKTIEYVIFEQRAGLTNTQEVQKEVFKLLIEESWILPQEGNKYTLNQRKMHEYSGIFFKT